MSLAEILVSFDFLITEQVNIKTTKGLVIPLSPSFLNQLSFLFCQPIAVMSSMFTNVEATPLSGKRFVGKRLGISRQITRQTASLLQGWGAVIFEAEQGDPDKGLGLVL